MKISTTLSILCASDILFFIAGHYWVADSAKGASGWIIPLILAVMGFVCFSAMSFSEMDD